jgi:hypothetical protein
VAEGADVAVGGAVGPAALSSVAGIAAVALSTGDSAGVLGEHAAPKTTTMIRTRAIDGCLPILSMLSVLFSVS